MARIAVVDDQLNILEEMAAALREAGHTVETYTDGVAALSGIRTNRPDLAILNIKMPRMDGLELLSRLREFTDLPVIYESYTTLEMLDAYFEQNPIGFCDFIEAPFHMPLLTNRVELALKRAAGLKSGVNGDIITIGALALDTDHCLARWKGENIPLTLSEILILRRLAQQPGYVMSRDALTAAAGFDSIYVDDRTIDSHIKRIRKKIRSIDPEFDAIETLYGVGFRYKS
ncbi:MAG: response regulator transcription factor [Neomegalonema sp.]|nr:response regulator transcription factor [Neomegalonema sp.]